MHLAGFFEAVDVCNVGVIQRCEHVRLTPETRQAIGVRAERFRQYLDRHTAAQFGVSGLIHFAHATRAELADDLVMCKLRTDHELMRICGGGFYQKSPVNHLFETWLAEKASEGLSWRVTAMSKL